MLTEWFWLLDEDEDELIKSDFRRNVMVDKKWTRGYQGDMKIPSDRLTVEQQMAKYDVGVALLAEHGYWEDADGTAEIFDKLVDIAN